MENRRRLLLVSNSTLYGGGYLDHCQEQIKTFLGTQVRKILFVPYALHDQTAYATLAREKLESLGYGLDSIHESSDPREAIRKAEAIFIGGGNTFRLLKMLYDNDLIHSIRKRVLELSNWFLSTSIHITWTQMLIALIWGKLVRKGLCSTMKN